MYSARFWRDATERVVKTFAQTLLTLILAGKTVSLLEIDWPNMLAVAGLAALVSLLTSIGSGTFGSPGTPSLVSTEPEPTPKVTGKAPAL